MTEIVDWKALQRKAKKHTCHDLETWYEHEAAALGKMIGGARGEPTREEILSYYGKLRNLTNISEFMIDEYKDPDKQRDLRVLHHKCFALAYFVKEVVLPRATDGVDIINMEDKVESGVPGNVAADPDPIESRMYGGDSKHNGRMHSHKGSTMMHMHGGGGVGHARDAHGRYK